MRFELDSSRRHFVYGTTAFVFTCLLFFAWIGLRFGFNSPPSSTGDELSYDSMAWELSRGHGFAVDFGNAAFKAPYDKAAEAHPELYSVGPATAGPIAFRPPLFPAIGASFNLVFGRQFYAVRFLNVMLMAATVGLLAWHVSRTAGTAAAIAGVLFCLADVRTRLYARSLLTEPLACFLAALLTLTFLQLTEKTNRIRLVAAGLLTGGSILTRSIVVLWLPGLVLMLCLILRHCQQQTWREVTRSLSVFIVAMLVVITPWSFRNITILERFSPMGTQGLMELSAGYSDIAYDNFGVWQNLMAVGFFDDVSTDGLNTVSYTHLTLPTICSV